MTLKEKHRALFEATGWLLHTLPLEDLSGFTPEQRAAIKHLDREWCAQVTQPRSAKPRMPLLRR